MCAIEWPEFDCFIVGTRGKSIKLWDFSEATDDILVSIFNDFLLLSFKPKSDCFILASSNSDPIGKRQYTSSMGMSSKCLLSFSCCEIPNNCTAIPRATNEFFWHAHWKRVDSSSVVIEFSDRVSFEINLKDLVIAACGNKTFAREPRNS